MTTVLLALGLLATGCTAADPPAAAEPVPSARATTGCARPNLPRTVRYRAIPGVAANLTSLDIHPPATACRAPVVVWVHGGGYHVGDKAGKGTATKTALFNANGWIFVSVNYRLTKPGDPHSARYPDHYTDVAASLAWVRAHIARYGGDPNRIAVLGHSAGADIVSNVVDQPRYLAAAKVPRSAIRCVGPLDTEGFDKVTSVGDDGEKAMWASALGNLPGYATKTSATRFIQKAPKLPPTIGVYRGTPRRQAIEKAYLAKVASTGARTTAIDARRLTHEQVNTRIGAPGDTVMTPPLVSFLRSCLR